ncbi:MAG: hypothetical protein EBX15_01485 [Acidimicrobiia bacterium]|nr:hypothetical protein [Acidimicrobiia bacterium]
MGDFGKGLRSFKKGLNEEGEASKDGQAPQPAAIPLDSVFSTVKWRSIGPFRGGRSNASTGVIGDPKTYYMGTTGGGVWKTDNMGISWRNISDGYFKSGTVGAIAVAPSDPNVVYVGMGEHAIRGVMTHSGDGVYRSTDAGKSWKKIGLDDTRHIARIVVHPKNPDVVYVAVQGDRWKGSAERGIYRTRDGGATWTQVLKGVNATSGASDLVRRGARRVQVRGSHGRRCHRLR